MVTEVTDEVFNRFHQDAKSGSGPRFSALTWYEKTSCFQSIRTGHTKRGYAAWYSVDPFGLLKGSRPRIQVAFRVSVLSVKPPTLSKRNSEESFPSRELTLPFGGPRS